MGKIVILGNEPDAYWVKQIGTECQFSKVVDLCAYDISAISKYLTDNISEDTESIVIDSDSITSTELCLTLALCTRLLISDLKRASLSGITIVSSLGIDSLLGYNPYSMLLGTAGFNVTSVEDSLYSINSNRAISYSEYVYEVIGRIKVLPGSGRHSIANEWGAGVLYSIVSGHKKEWKTGKVTLYALYSYAAALQVSEVESIVLGGPNAQTFNDKIALNASCKCLLIDDEARKGWDSALEAMLPKSQIDVYDKEASDYEALPECLRKNIEKGEYDIIFLDLRMVGIKEDAQNNPSKLSGMKILKGIKKINKGIQVIMLTATNKSWNVKALLDAGANGYYMKESPEYRFSNSFSRENAHALLDTIRQCYDNRFLQDIYVDKETIKMNSQLSEDICKQLDISFNLICKATNEDDIAFAYIALEQIFEICSKSFISYRIDKNESHEKIAFFNKDRRVCLDCTQRNKVPLTFGSPLYLRVMAIYCQLFNGTSIRVDHLKELIRLRNDYMHMNNKNERTTLDSSRKSGITKANYQDLFNTMFDFLNVIE